MPANGILGKLRACLNRSRAWLAEDVLGPRGAGWDEASLEALETRLLSADVGVEATEWVIERLRKPARELAALDAGAMLEQTAVDLLQAIDTPLELPPSPRPFVILVVGVNGTGKTTTIGKLAKHFASEGLSVMLAAGDTYRAAAAAQLEEWAKRSGAAFVAQASGADPAAVIFDALTAAKRRGTDIVIADTAGRLHTAGGLMDELKKVKRVIAKFDASAPHETLLVLDASQGQNALVQATQFHKTLGVSGLVITKLDGTAKGGILLAIARQLDIPVRYVATGESVEDLVPFNAAEYAAALLKEPSP